MDGARVRTVWNRLVRGRPWSALLAWPLAAGAAIVALVRVLGLDAGVPLVQIVAFTPYLAIGCGAAAVLSGLLRRPLATAVTAVAALCLAAVVVPRALGSPATGPGTPLVVMSANLRYGGADAASIVDLVRDATVDVLVLQELTPEGEQALLDQGLAEALPFRESHPAPRASGSAVYARWPLSDGGVRSASDDGFQQAYATITLDHGSVIVESVHPVPPNSVPRTHEWLIGLSNQAPANADGPPRILAGDFNATLDHRALRALLATGYRDAADAVGAGLTPTWPYYGPRSAVTPKVALDHIVVPHGIGVRDFRAVTIPRTDHRAILATLLIPPA
ncbi:MAG: endonuclease/exonuclease/phosphatase family protein [Micromonosporaceae bacterium]|nr:endonuclease/exonuclease/phosphatase family protein [Micromonosporaceae bacterium]